MNGDWAVSGYRHVRELGEGATGRVMLAVHEATDAPVAIKYLSPRLLGEASFLTRFRDEARLLSEIEDPSLVLLHEYVETPEGAAIVMELVNGVSLASLIKAEGKTTPEAALAVLKGSLQGLAATHRAGIVHRDFKPGNVLVSGDGVSKLADFGIAVRAGADAPAAGTPAYMAPEQWGGGPVTTAADVYAATAVFYECLTGEKPFQAPTMATLAIAHRSAPVPLDQVPEPLAELVTAGLAKDPNDRPVTASVFLGRLEALAFASYGVGWEERGRNHLIERAAILTLLFPLSRSLPKAGSGLAFSRLGRAGNKGLRRGLLAGAGALLVLAGGTTAVVSASGGDGKATTLPASSFPGAPPGGPSVPVDGGPVDDPSGGSAKASPEAPATPANLGNSPKPKPSGSTDPSDPGPGRPSTPTPSSPAPSPTFGATAVQVTGLTLSGSVATAQVKVKASGKGQVTLVVRFSMGTSPVEHGTETKRIEVDGETTVSITHDYQNCPRGAFSVRASASPGSAAAHELKQTAECKRG